MDEIYKSKSIAEHIEAGYYSDGSYYATYGNYRGTMVDKNVHLFRNIHPTRVKYEKNKWQKDRDECMELTYENVKDSLNDKSAEYYQNCLKERGYQF